MAKWPLLGIVALVRAIAFFALWLLLVDGTDEPNLITGGVCALAAALLAARVESLRTVHARPRLGMLRNVHRPLVLLVTDTGRVTGALIQRLVLRRRICGEFQAVRYRATGDSSDDVARRLLSEWAASVAANRYAIGIDRARHVMLVHQLVPARGPLDPLELG